MFHRLQHAFITPAGGLQPPEDGARGASCETLDTAAAAAVGPGAQPVGLDVDLERAGRVLVGCSAARAEVGLG